MRQTKRVTQDRRVRNLCIDLLRTHKTMDALTEAFSKAELEEKKILTEMDSIFFPDLSDLPKIPQTCGGLSPAVGQKPVPVDGQIVIPPGKTLHFGSSPKGLPGEETESDA